MGGSTRPIVEMSVIFILVVAVLGGGLIVASNAGLLPEGYDQPSSYDGPTTAPEPPSTEPTPTATPLPDRDPDDPGTSTYTYEYGFALDSSRLERAILEETNRARSEHDSGRVEWDPVVASVARAHSEDMSSRDYFSHTNPDEEHPYERYRAVRPDGCPAGFGENIYWASVGVVVDTRPENHSELAAYVVRGWLDSPSHNATLLSARYDGLGVGMHVSPEGGIYATQNFCDR